MSAAPRSCGPTISSGGISSRNRDGIDIPPPPQVARRQAWDRNSRRFARVMPDVREPPLLLQLALVVQRPVVREHALLQAAR